MKVKICLITIIFSLGITSNTVLADDPTRPDIVVPKTAKASQVRALKLTMIQSSERGNRAVINGRSYAEGDQVGNYEVKTIGASEVVLKNNKGTVRLSLITKGALRKKS